MLSAIIKDRAVLCLFDNPVPIAYLNIYEEGDIWLKIKGCESCSLENRKRCCNGCPMFTDIGCFLHLQNQETKPYRCVVYPVPDVCLGWCSLEFKSLKGTHLGKIRRVRKPGNIFEDE